LLATLLVTVYLARREPPRRTTLSRTTQLPSQSLARHHPRV